jgi:hypothetical protein
MPSHSTRDIAGILSGCISSQQRRRRRDYYIYLNNALRYALQTSNSHADTLLLNFPNSTDENPLFLNPSIPAAVMSSPTTPSTLFQPEYRAPGLTGVDTQGRIKEYILEFCPKLVAIGGWSDSNRYRSIINATKSAVHEHAFGPRVLNNYREWVIPCF